MKAGYTNKSKGSSENNGRILQQKTLQLHERIKELGCLYGISKLVENSGGIFSKIAQGTVDLVPDSWQYPKSTCASIAIDEAVFKTDNFRKSKWKQAANIYAHGKHAGFIEVYYLDEKPGLDEGPFLKEERDLIDAIAERLGHIKGRIDAENELMEYREKMFRAEQLASLGTIGSAVAHRLNQPLSIIRMSIQKALRDLQNPESVEIVREMLDDSLDQVSLASSVVKDFLSLGHTSSKRNAKLSIYEIAVKTIAVFNEIDENIKFKLIIDDSLKAIPSIKGVAGEIEQMFFILSQNAMQAAKPNKNQWLKINGDVREGQVELVFSDNCGGIEPCDLDKIFEPFFTTKSAEHGTGFGLAILQQIVTNHNGSIRVESELDKGTTFYIQFPVKG